MSRITNNNVATSDIWSVEWSETRVNFTDFWNTLNDQQTQAKEAARQRAIYKIADILAEYDSDDSREKTRRHVEQARVLLDENLQIFSNGLVSHDERNERIQRVAGDFRRLKWDRVYCFLNAPLQTTDLSHEQETQARHLQVENFKRLCFTSTVNMQCHEEYEATVGDYATLLSKTRDFITKYSVHSYQSIFTFNGHGEKKGFILADGTIIPLHTYLKDLRNLIREFSLENTWLVLPQCHAHCCTPEDETDPADVKIIPLSSEACINTDFTVKLNPSNKNIVDDSNHLALNALAMKISQEPFISQVKPSSLVENAEVQAVKRGRPASRRQPALRNVSPVQDVTPLHLQNCSDSPRKPRRDDDDSTTSRKREKASRSRSPNSRKRRLSNENGGGLKEDGRKRRRHASLPVAGQTQSNKENQKDHYCVIL